MCKEVIKKSSAEMSQSSSGVPSEQLVMNGGRFLKRQSEMVGKRGHIVSIVEWSNKLYKRVINPVINPKHVYK
jgi:hypothetical protein